MIDPTNIEWPLEKKYFWQTQTVTEEIQLVVLEICEFESRRNGVLIQLLWWHIFALSGHQSEEQNQILFGLRVI